MAEEKTKEKSKKTNWKTTDSRFVGFIDLLGFKDKVMRKSHSEIYDELSKISNAKKDIEDVTRNIDDSDYFNDSDIYIVSFSDSIVMFSKNDDYKNFEYFLVMLRYLFSKAISHGIALKGGIAHGEISINKSEQIYFGQPIIDAYLIEEDVNYLGVTCHNSIDAYLKANNSNVDSSTLIGGLLFETSTPLKCGKIVHFNLDWFVMLPNEVTASKENLIIEIQEILKNFNQTVSGSPRKYVDNTLELFNSLTNEEKINLKPLSIK
jgi:hypothetical protein